MESMDAMWRPLNTSWGWQRSRWHVRCVLCRWDQEEHSRLLGHDSAWRIGFCLVFELAPSTRISFFWEWVMFMHGFSGARTRLRFWYNISPISRITLYSMVRCTCLQRIPSRQSHSQKLRRLGSFPTRVPAALSHRHRNFAFRQTFMRGVLSAIHFKTCMWWPTRAGEMQPWYVFMLCFSKHALPPF